MSNTIPIPPLLALPTELRLKIYTSLISSSLFTCSPSTIFSLILTCRQIHADISTSFLPTISPLLRAQHAWKTTPAFSPHAPPLRINLLTPPHLKPAKTRLSIDTPVRFEEEIDHPSRAFVALHTTARILWPLFTHSWAEVRLSFYLQPHDMKEDDDDEDFRIATWRVDGKVRTGLNLFFMRILFQNLIYEFGDADAGEEDGVGRGDGRPIGSMEMRMGIRVGRLSLDFGNPQLEIGEGALGQILVVLNTARRAPKLFRTRGIKRSWIGRVGTEEGRRDSTDQYNLGWTLSLDFEPCLEPGVGAVWMCEDDGAVMLQIKRVGKWNGEVEAQGMIDLEERYMARTREEDEKWTEIEEGD